jgi:hypothetical protein
MPFKHEQRLNNVYELNFYLTEKEELCEHQSVNVDQGTSLCLLFRYIRGT